MASPNKYTNPVTQLEYLTKDIFDEDLLKSFKPFHLLQMATGTCRVNSKHCFVTGPTISQKIYTIICIIFNAFASYFFAKNFFISRTNIPTSLIIFSCIGVLAQFLQCSINLIHSRFFNTDENVQLYRKFQSIDRKLQIRNNNLIHRIIFNIHIFQTVYSLVGMSTTLVNVSLTVRDAARLFAIFGSMSFYIELTFFFNLVSLTTLKFRYVNELLKLGYKDNKKIIKSENLGFFRRNFSVSKNRIKCIIHTFNIQISDNIIIECVDELFDVYKLILKLFKLQVFLFSVTYIFLVLFIIETLIMSATLSLTYNDWYDMCSLLQVNLLFVIIISISCETFNNEIKSLKATCVRLLSIYQQGPTWLKAKTIVRIIEENDIVFNIYGMLVVDGHLPFKLFAFTMTYTVVFLQFAYLT